jgi:uncharacterized coiled-coil protein SlyX
MYRALWIAAALSLGACAQLEREEPPPAARPTVEPQVQVIRDPELERQVTQLEIQLMERDALIESLNTRLDQALQEVVGTMRKLRSLATRAEAASAMAEADVALQAIGGSGRDSPEFKQASRLMQQSSDEFKRSNYGGALYLAVQARAMARLHGLTGGVGKLRPGEIAFAAPVKLRANTRSNVRAGPGTNFPVSFSTDSGNGLSGLSYLGEWIRVTNGTGSEGWIHGSLVRRRGHTNP